ncbi:DUF4124 domain-containing protein [Litorilituus sediminis]|uniref:DUF4124 domain-containing protein n=1 Tax=Litorilituus sediminis TaxID=718192 RepID=A0A4P6P277_9GAMM|nr:DUF4124 domain-containing protein [Litorilituus sediminis]QBG35331.1 DUF4124 domain-containing protein [Litorilituus sediminis]
MNTKVKHLPKEFTYCLLAISIAIVGNLYSPPVAAKDIAIYRWVDKNNVVHFSQNLPKDDNYTQLTTVSSFKALSKKERQALKERDAAEKVLAEEKEQLVANEETFKRNCQAAKDNIKMLSSFNEVLITEENSDGTTTNRVLSDQEKQEQLALSKKHMGLYCREE